MNAPYGLEASAIALGELCGGDRELLGEFARVRRALLDGDPTEAEQLLFALERAVGRRMNRLRADARAVADANASAVEVVARQEGLASELRSQNSQLARHTAALEAARRAADKQSRAVAQANVEAVSMLDQQAEALESLRHRATQLESANRALEDKAVRDDLTGLFNWGCFQEQLAYEVARARRYGRDVALVLADADRFKQLNDTHGHLVGDSVLRKLGAIIRSSVRSSDIVTRAAIRPFAARYGGEEFAIILPETSLEGGEVFAERLRRIVASTSFSHVTGAPVGVVTISVGIAAFADADADAAGVIARADAALYRAKRNGRNRVEIGLGAGKS